MIQNALSIWSAFFDGVGCFIRTIVWDIRKSGGDISQSFMDIRTKPALFRTMEGYIRTSRFY